MKNITTKRRTEIKQSVLQIFTDGSFADLPVRVKAIAKSYPNCRLIPYSKIAETRHMTVEQLIYEVESSDAFTEYDSYKDKYLIGYNDTDASVMASKRYRWSIAHEVGHMVLKHHITYKKWRTSRNNISVAEYASLEQEADLFASYLLVPYGALHSKNINSAEQIKTLCNISAESSSYHFNKYSKWAEREKLDDYDIAIGSCFYKYLKCNICNNVIHRQDIMSFCSICKGQTFTFCDPEDAENILYSKIDINSKYKAVTCPVCGNKNTDISGDYCQICGTMIKNKCSAEPDYFYTSKTNDCIGRKGLPGNARYCDRCGAPSTFLLNKLLPFWNEPDEEDVK